MIAPHEGNGHSRRERPEVPSTRSMLTKSRIVQITALIAALAATYMTAHNRGRVQGHKEGQARGKIQERAQAAITNRENASNASSLIEVQLIMLRIEMQADANNANENSAYRSTAMYKQVYENYKLLLADYEEILKLALEGSDFPPHPQKTSKERRQIEINIRTIGNNVDQLWQIEEALLEAMEAFKILPKPDSHLQQKRGIDAPNLQPPKREPHQSPPTHTKPLRRQAPIRTAAIHRVRNR